MQKKFVLSIVTFILSFTLYDFALAGSSLIAQVQLNPELKPGYATNFTMASDQSAAGYANYVLQIVAGSLIYIAGPLAVLMIAYGGWNYVNARGDQTKLEESKKTLIWAACGLGAIIISYSVVSNVINIVLGTTNTVPTKTTQGTNPDLAPGSENLKSNELGEEGSFGGKAIKVSPPGSP